MSARGITRLQASVAPARLRATVAAPTSLRFGAHTIVRHKSEHVKLEDLKKTPLYDFHMSHLGKMVPFAGHQMPVTYPALSIAESHKWTRLSASLFDVSHMVQHTFKGPDAAAFLEKVTPSSWKGQELLQGKLTTFLWPDTGGIVDDSVITRVGEEEFYVVTNGACYEKDLKYFDEELGKFGGRVEWTTMANSGLVALQGPKSADVLKSVLASDVNLDDIYFGTAFWAELKLPGGGKTHPVLISRAGYTGEDGFELSFQGDKYPAAESTLEAVKQMHAANPATLRMAGLGARDSLRLEAGMCLYGNDLDDTTTPPEAALGWIIPPERREQGGFHGADIIVPQLRSKKAGGTGVTRRRVGLVVDKAPARAGAAIKVDGEEVGVVTSGCPSPTLGANIAMGYIKTGLSKAGTKVDVMVRNNARSAEITKMPFVLSHLRRRPS